MQLIKQSESTAARRRIFISTDTASLTVAQLRISKAGAAAAAGGGTLTELAAGAIAGWYVYEPTAAECNTLGVLSVMMEAGDGNLVGHSAAMIVPYDPYAHPWDLSKDGRTMWEHQVAQTAVLAGPIADAQGGSGVNTFKDPTGANARVTVTVDAQGNRSAVTHSSTGA